eukprot:1192919-Prorocentrum_minimum.AAC.3
MAQRIGVCSHNSTAPRTYSFNSDYYFHLSTKVYAQYNCPQQHLRLLYLLVSKNPIPTTSTVLASSTRRRDVCNSPNPHRHRSK